MSFNGHAAVLLFEDPIRSDARQTIDQLRAMGFTDLVMLTGDHPEVARRTAETLGLDSYHANLLPEEKIEHVRQIRESVGAVAMVGDGVNDAPALAHADVGIAMASIGSDAALEAAPIVLMSNTFGRLGFVANHARRTSRIIWQNLTLAISVIAVLSVFAVAGKVDLPLAVIAHEGSTLVVAANALRLLRA
jgi:Zn2+/Cd2+-exporting ATPase